MIDGLNARRAKGFKLGGPTISKYNQNQIKELKEKGLSEMKIAKKLGISRGSVRKYK